MQKKLYLASQSPRRKDLLQQIGLDFEVKTDPNFKELEAINMDANELVLHNAKGKAEAIESQTPHALILGADTVVSLEGQIFEKPADPKEAVSMLMSLQGKKHEVYTGLYLIDTEKEEALPWVETTEVWMAALSKEEVEAYVRQEYVLDKAAAYGIQGLAALFVREIKGDYNNVLGLPLYRLGMMLRRFGQNPLL